MEDTPAADRSPALQELVPAIPTEIGPENRLWLSLGAVALVVLLGACGGSGGDDGAPGAAGDGREADRTGATEAARQAPVLLVSLDGLGTDLLDRAPTPVLDRVAAEGVRARYLEPVFPTHTFPNHYTVVTGLYPDHHGIVANSMFDPETGEWFRLDDREAVEDPRWWGGEPIWVTAQEQGLTAHTLFWPGSEAPIQGVRPTRWLRYDESLSYRSRVDSVLSWLALPRERRPDFVTLYFEEPDGTAHDHGPRAPETMAAAARVDSALGWLLEGLEERGQLDRVDLLVISDHGIVSSSPRRVIRLEDHLPEGLPMDSVRVVTHGPVAMLDARSGRPATVRQLLAALRGAHPRVEVHRKEGLPEHLHFGEHPRIPPVVALVDPGWLLLAGLPAGDGWQERIHRGMHGYDPTAPSMRSVFLARGPSFRRGTTVPPFSSVHLYELMSHLLELEPAPNDGSLDSVRAVLAEPGRP